MWHGESPAGGPLLTIVEPKGQARIPGRRLRSAGLPGRNWRPRAIRGLAGERCGGVGAVEGVNISVNGRLSAGAETPSFAINSVTAARAAGISRALRHGLEHADVAHIQGLIGLIP